MRLRDLRSVKSRGNKFLKRSIRSIVWHGSSKKKKMLRSET